MKKGRFLIAGAALIIVIMVITVSFFYDQDFNNMSQADSTAALLNYLKENENKDIKPNELKQYICTKFKDQESDYYLIRSKSYSAKKQLNDVYAVVVSGSKGKYKCEKATPTLSLDSPEDVEDADYTPYVQFTLPVTDNVYFLVGKIFNNSYLPYYQGKMLKLDKDNVYAIGSKTETPAVEIYH